MKKQVVALQVNVEGAEELSNKVNKAMNLIKEANAILNDVAKNSTLEVSITSSNQNEYRNSDTLD